jgi:hypothetical protein
VQTTRVLVVVLVEFTSRVQAGQDQFDTGNLLLRMDVDRHTATVIGDLDRTIGVDLDFDFFAVTGERFVDAVVNDLVSEVIRPRRIRVHARPPPDRFETTKDLDVGRIVTFAHLLVCPKRKQKCRGGF